MEKYEIRRTRKFEKDYEKALLRKKNIDKFVEVLRYLEVGKALPEIYKDHPLRNCKEYKNCRELHIEPDWILVYKYYNDVLVLVLFRMGTHLDLF